MATIYDIAKLAGVSTATVSRSFGNSASLNRRTKEKVLEVALGLNYRPRTGSSVHALRSPVTSPSTRNRTIGFEYFSYTPSDMLPTNGFYSSVLAGAQAEAAALGMHMLMSTTHRQRTCADLPAMVKEQAVAGMLLVGTADSEVLESFVKYVPHIVLLDNRDPSGRYDSVFSDGFGGGYQAAKHLIELGHRKIGFLTSKISEAAFKDRYNGYICAHVHSGLSVDPANLLQVGSREDINDQSLSGDDLRERIVNEIAEYLRRPQRPSAFVAANDDYAVSLIRACTLMNLSVPTDLSVVGFDDLAGVADIDPPLTTVRLNTIDMGRSAVRRLHRRMVAAKDGSGDLSGVCEQFPVKLVVRRSTAAPIFN